MKRLILAMAITLVAAVPADGQSLTVFGGLGGRSGASQITGDEQVVGVVGTICSAAAVAASPIISEAGLVMISPANTSPLLRLLVLYQYVPATTGP